jgi:hypothetical protein
MPHVPGIVTHDSSHRTSTPKGFNAFLPRTSIYIYISICVCVHKSPSHKTSTPWASTPFYHAQVYIYICV